MDKIVDFRAKMEGQIEKHIDAAARLTLWIEQLDAEGFDWNNVTEAQAWAITHTKCSK